MQKQQKIFFCVYFRFTTVLPAVSQLLFCGCASAAARNSIHITVIFKNQLCRCAKSRSKNCRNWNRTYIAFILSVLSLSVRAAGRIAYGFHRIQANFTGGQFLCYFAFSVSSLPCPATGTLLCENTANSGAKVWYTARFCAILDKKSTQPGRARHKRGHT